MEIEVNLNPKHKILIKKGYFRERAIPKGYVITDVNVAGEYKELINGKIVSDRIYILLPGEDSKSPETVQKIWDTIPNDVERIIAFGGGVVGDVAGFIASSYNRGIDLIHIPTTLLAMVDSSIGGKNGINLRGIKNKIGYFHQPVLNIIDTYFLGTLSPKEFKNGTAEIIKSAYLFGEPSLERFYDPKKGSLSLFDSDLEEIIYQCCKNKVDLVVKDEKDEGPRHALNFGHTIGHAIELNCGLSHGEAISIGMMKELELAILLGYKSHSQHVKLRKAFEANDLPTNLPNNFNLQKTIEAMRYDKKGKCIFAFSLEDYKELVEEEAIYEVLTI